MPELNQAQLQADLIRDEDLKLRGYQDSLGIWSIGVGHNVQDKPISRRAALMILEDDVADVLGDLDRNLPWWRTLSESRQRALANMTFNLGISRLLGFRNALQALQAGDYESAAGEMLASKWALQVGPRAARLAEMVRTG